MFGIRLRRAITVTTCGAVAAACLFASPARADDGFAIDDPAPAFPSVGTSTTVSCSDAKYTTKWTGAVSDDLYASGNWTSGFPSANGDFGCVPAAATRQPAARTLGLAANQLDSEAGSLLTVNAGATLEANLASTLAGTLTVNGTVTAHGTLTLDGPSTLASGAIDLATNGQLVNNGAMTTTGSNTIATSATGSLVNNGIITTSGYGINASANITNNPSAVINLGNGSTFLATGPTFAINQAGNVNLGGFAVFRTDNQAYVQSASTATINATGTDPGVIYAPSISISNGLVLGYVEFSGGGPATITGSTVVDGNLLSDNDLTVAGGTINVGGSGTIGTLVAQSNLTLTGGAINLEDDGANADHLVVGGALSQSGGTITYGPLPGVTIPDGSTRTLAGYSGTDLTARSITGLVPANQRLTTSVGPAALTASVHAAPVTPVTPAPAQPADSYRFVGLDGTVYAYGTTSLSPVGTAAKNIVGISETPDRNGYFLVGADGGVFAYGNAHFQGSEGGKTLNAPVVSITANPAGTGYWTVASDGGVFAYGDAAFAGSMGGKRLSSPVTALVPTSTGHGYYLVAKDGGVFAYGDAVFQGSLGGQRLNAPIAGAAMSPNGHGYTLVAADGGVFAFGDARGFHGSLGSTKLNSPIVGMQYSASGDGYWLIAADGGVFAFDAPFLGNATSKSGAQITG